MAALLAARLRAGLGGGVRNLRHGSIPDYCVKSLERPPRSQRAVHSREAAVHIHLLSKMADLKRSDGHESDLLAPELIHLAEDVRLLCLQFVPTSKVCHLGVFREEGAIGSLDR